MTSDRKLPDVTDMQTLDSLPTTQLEYKFPFGRELHDMTELDRRVSAISWFVVDNF